MSRLRELQTSLRSSHHQRLHACFLRHHLIEPLTERNEESNEEPAKSEFSALGIALQEAGDVFRLFGLYLSTRIDLLPIDGCLELSRIPGSAQATPWAEVEEFVEQELGVGISQGLLAVEPLPYESSILRDCYIAMLVTGENVSLQVLRNEFRLFPAEQVNALSLLRDCRLFEHWTDPGIQEVIDDFAGELRLRIDQLRAATNFEALAADAEDSEGLWAPRILKEYCRRRVLALEQRPSTKLSFVHRGNRNSEPSIPSTGAFDASCEKVARMLYLSWLRAVFHGRVFPVKFCLDDISLLEDGRVAFLGEVFAPSWPDSKEKMWKYLLAAGADNPDESCAILLSMMTTAATRKENDSHSLQEVLAAFRQSVTCFMSAPGQPDFCSGMAARVLRQLQIAIELGYRPRPFLVSFYRGLFSVLAAVRELQPQGDPLMEGLEDMWAADIFASARRMMRLDPLVDIGGKYLAAMIELPVKLDAILSNATLKTGEDAAEEAFSTASKNDPSYPLAMVLLLVAVFLLVRYGPVHFATVWSDRISFSICCLIGVLVVRLAARP